MASAHPSDGGSSRPYSDAEPKPAAPAKNETQELLDQVLEATLELSNADEPFQDDQMRTLVAVARRRKDEPLTVEIVMELVQTVLRMRYRRLIGTSSLWERMTRHIAETIFEDPQTKEKMAVLWSRLGEAAK